MKIRKIQQPTDFPSTNIVGGYKESDSDTYNCNYINGLTEKGFDCANWSLSWGESIYNQTTWVNVTASPTLTFTMSKAGRAVIRYGAIVYVNNYTGQLGVAVDGNNVNTSDNCATTNTTDTNGIHLEGVVVVELSKGTHIVNIQWKTQRENYMYLKSYSSHHLEVQEL